MASNPEVCMGIFLVCCSATLKPSIVMSKVQVCPQSITRKESKSQPCGKTRCFLPIPPLVRSLTRSLSADAPRCPAPPNAHCSYKFLSSPPFHCTTAPRLLARPSIIPSCARPGLPRPHPTHLRRHCLFCQRPRAAACPQALQGFKGRVSRCERESVA